MKVTNQDAEHKEDRRTSLRHTIKNDISVIIAFAQLVKVNPVDARSGEFLEKIESRSKAILSHVESFLNEEEKDEN